MSVHDELGPVLEVDRLIHEPARLLILSILAGAAEVEFRFIERLTGLTRGNLSSHLTKLEAGGLIEADKSFRAKRPVTTLRITAAGRAGLTRYREQMTRVVAGIPTDSNEDR